MKRLPYLFRVIIIMVVIMMCLVNCASASTYAISSTFFLGITEEGTVLIPFYDVSDIDVYAHMAEEVASWTDVKTVLLGRTPMNECAIGLKNDGTLLYTSSASFSHSPTPIEDWKDIVDLQGSSVLYGLKADGTVLCTSDSIQKILNNQIPAQQVPKFTKISCCGFCLAGIAEDGMVYCLTDSARVIPQKMSDNTVSVACGRYFVGALDADGTVSVFMTDLTITDEYDSVADWKDIISIAADDTYLYGLTKDGKILSSAKKRYLSENVENKGFISMVPFMYEAVGMKEDGKVYLLEAYPNESILNALNGFVGVKQE